MFARFNNNQSEPYFFVNPSVFIFKRVFFLVILKLSNIKTAMENYFGTTWEALFAIAISTFVLFISIIILVRISGKRSFSKMSSFDFASTIAIGSIIASGILLKDITLIKTLVALICIFALQSLVAYLMRYTPFQKLVDNQPLLLMDGSIILHENLKKAHVTERDLRAKLREANVKQIAHVKAVVLERTGDLSVLHSENTEAIDQWLLEDVEKK